MVRRLVEVHALHALDRLDLVADLLCVVVGDIGDHDLGCTKCRELLIHQIQTHSGGAAVGQILRQVVLDLDPRAGEQ